MTSTSDGGGYWLVASDGGVFAFGDAQFHGSAGSFDLNRPITGIISTDDDGGYLLVADDGGLFAFGTPRSTEASEVRGSRASSESRRDRRAVPLANDSTRRVPGRGRTRGITKCCGHLATGSARHQLIEHPVERTDGHRQVSLPLLEVHRGTREVRGEPPAVVEGHHQIL